MPKNNQKEHIIVVLAENEKGVLNRISSTLRRRRFNLQKISAGPTEKKNITHITLTFSGQEVNVEQVVKQLYKVINVLKITDLTDDEKVVREMALIKIHVPASKQTDVIKLVDVFRAKIVDAQKNSMIIEITGTEDKINSFIDLVRGYDVKEIRRTGLIAMAKE